MCERQRNMSFNKWCFVPRCTNTSKNSNKIFITVPKNLSNRAKWFTAARRAIQGISPKSALYCCEDHFNLEEDMDNYIEYRLSKVKARMKPEVVPHIFTCQPDKKTTKLRTSSENRARKRMISEILSAHESSIREQISEDPKPSTSASSESEPAEITESFVEINSTKMDEKLIEKVKEHEFLYKQTSVQYRDHSIRQEAWEEIGKELKIPAEQAKLKWDRLRRCFTNARNRRLHHKSYGATKTTPPWKFHHQMSFLLPYCEIRPPRSNSRNTKTKKKALVFEKEEEETEIEQIEDEEEENEDVVIVVVKDEKLDNKNENMTDLQVEYENLAEIDDTDRENIEEKHTEFVNNINQRYENSDLRSRNYEEQEKSAESNKYNFPLDIDDTDMFFLSMAKITKQLPKAEQVSVKMDVSNAVLRAELRNAQREQQYTYNYAPHTSTVTATPL